MRRSITSFLVSNKFKVYARAIYEMFKLLKAARDKWDKRERDYRSDFEESVELYKDVTQSWLLSVCKGPILSLLTDQSIK